MLQKMCPCGEPAMEGKSFCSYECWRIHVSTAEYRKEQASLLMLKMSGVVVAFSVFLIVIRAC